MALSKPIYNLLGAYFEQLFTHPIRTKSITSCLLAVSANYCSQRITGPYVEHRSLLAYALFGLLFGGTVPHYFYYIVENLLRQNLKFRKFWFFCTERLLYAPIFQALSLYFLSRFEGYNNDATIIKLRSLYWPLLKANWSYLSFPVFMNIYFVPSLVMYIVYKFVPSDKLLQFQLRVLISNLIGFLWVIFVANKRRAANRKPKGKSS